MQVADDVEGAGIVAMVATQRHPHDLDLVGIAEDLPENIVCYHFSDRFDGEKLHFDYTLTPGVATTTNALHVLAMEGIEVPGA